MDTSHAWKTTAKRTLAMGAICVAALAAAWIVVDNRAGDGQVPAPTTAEKITDVDWHNAAITLPPHPSQDCPSGPTQFKPASSNKGELLGQMAWGPGEKRATNLILMPSAVAYGDLTADGKPEAVLYIRCDRSPQAVTEFNLGGQLIVVSMNTDRTLTAIAYAGLLHAQYPAFRVDNGNLLAQLRYEYIGDAGTVHSPYAPAHTRTYKWDGTNFQQIAGRTTPLVISADKGRHGAPVNLPAITKDGSIVCPAAKISFLEGEAEFQGHTYALGGMAKPTDVDADGDEEVLLQIKQQTPGGATCDSLVLLKQGSDQFETLDLPVAGAGQYIIEDGWTFAGNTLTARVRDRNTGTISTHVARWSGTQFDKRLVG